MTRLSAADHRRVREVVWTLGEETGAFSVTALDALRALVPCDVVAYHDGRRISHVGEPLGEMTDELRALHRQYDHQDPLRRARGAQKHTDFVTHRAYRRLELYQLVDRPLGVEFMMQLWLTPDGARPSRIEFDRSDRDFSERDRAVLDVVAPYLERHCGRGANLTPRQHEILSLVADGLTNGEIALALGISPETVRKHLENAYTVLGVHTRTAAVAALR
jgi:DNA-binding CsgD family transcriptional regulator